MKSQGGWLTLIASEAALPEQAAALRPNVKKVITVMLILRLILVCATLAFCSCATSPDVNQHQWDVEISPVEGKHATFELLVRRQHSEHKGNSKGGDSIGVVALAGEGRKTDSLEYRINSAQYYYEAGLKVFWINDFYVRAEYDATYRVTGVNKKVFDEQSVRGVTRFCIEEGRDNMPSKKGQQRGL